MLDEIPQLLNKAGTRMQVRIMQPAINIRANKHMLTCYQAKNEVVDPIL